VDRLDLDTDKPTEEDILKKFHLVDDDLVLLNKTTLRVKTNYKGDRLYWTRPPVGRGSSQRSGLCL